MSTNCDTCGDPAHPSRLLQAVGWGARVCESCRDLIRSGFMPEVALPVTGPDGPASSITKTDTSDAIHNQKR